MERDDHYNLLRMHLIDEQFAPISSATRFRPRLGMIIRKFHR